MVNKNHLHKSIYTSTFPNCSSLIILSNYDLLFNTHIFVCICDALRNLVPFIQFKKREKHPWKSVTFSKVASEEPATLRKVTLLHGHSSRFLNCTNDTKSHNASHLILYLIPFTGKVNSATTVAFKILFNEISSAPPKVFWKSSC